MNFIIEEKLTLDVEHPISFCQDIPSNLENLLTLNYCNKFINNRFYIKVMNIDGYTDVFIQSNNSGFGSITCVVKFLTILYVQHSIIFDLDVISTEVNKNITVHKCTSSRYPKITFMAPYTEKLNGTIPMGKILSIGINKASENIIIFDVIKYIEPILLPYDFTEELNSSAINQKFMELLNDKKFNKLVSPLSDLKIDYKSGGKPCFVYHHGKITSGTTDTYYQNYTNISDRELCWKMLDSAIYNFIQF